MCDLSAIGSSSVTHLHNDLTGKASVRNLLSRLRFRWMWKSLEKEDNVMRLVIDTPHVFRECVSKEHCNAVWAIFIQRSNVSIDFPLSPFTLYTSPLVDACSMEVTCSLPADFLRLRTAADFRRSKKYGLILSITLEVFPSSSQCMNSNIDNFVSAMTLEMSKNNEICNLEV